MEDNNILPTVLLAAAVMELVMIPVVGGKMKGQQKMIVSGAMFSGALITGLLGVAFWMKWI